MHLCPSLPPARRGRRSVQPPAASRAPGPLHLPCIPQTLPRRLLQAHMVQPRLAKGRAQLPLHRTADGARCFISFLFSKLRPQHLERPGT